MVEIMERINGNLKQPGWTAKITISIFAKRKLIKNLHYEKDLFFVCCNADGVYLTRAGYRNF